MVWYSFIMFSSLNSFLNCGTPYGFCNTLTN